MSERRPSSATARWRNPPIAAISDSTPRAAIASWARSPSSTDDWRSSSPRRSTRKPMSRRSSAAGSRPWTRIAGSPASAAASPSAASVSCGWPAGASVPVAAAAGTRSSPDAPLRASVWARSTRSAGAGATTASELAGTMTRSVGSRTSSAGTRARSTRTQPTPRASSPYGTGAPIESASGSSVARISWSGAIAGKCAARGGCVAWPGRVAGRVARARVDRQAFQPERCEADRNAHRSNRQRSSMDGSPSVPAGSCARRLERSAIRGARRERAGGGRGRGGGGAGGDAEPEDRTAAP